MPFPFFTKNRAITRRDTTHPAAQPFTADPFPPSPRGSPARITRAVPPPPVCGVPCRRPLSPRIGLPRARRPPWQPAGHRLPPRTRVLGDLFRSPNRDSCQIASVFLRMWQEGALVKVFGGRAKKLPGVSQAPPPPGFRGGGANVIPPGFCKTLVQV